VPMLSEINGLLDIPRIEKEVNARMGYKERVNLLEAQIKQS